MIARTRLVVVALAIASVAAGFFAVRSKPTPGPVLRDFESYYAAGTTWRYHGDPYGRDVWRTERTIPGVVATRDELLPFVGPPFGLPLWDAFARLPWPAATFAWTCVLALSTAAIVFGSLRLAGPKSDALDVVAALVLLAGFGPLTSGLALGQVAVVSCAGIVLTPFLLGPRRVFAATAAAAAVILQPNLAIVLAARLGDRRAAIAFAFAAFVAIGGSLVAAGGLDGLAHYLGVLRDHASAERFIAIQTSPAAVVRALGASERASSALGLALAALAVVAVAIQCASGRYAANDRLALACAAAPLVFPFAHEHDFAIVFFPALLVVRRARGAVWVVAALAVLGVAVDWLGLAQRPTGVLETAALALAAALALVVLGDRERATLPAYRFLPAAMALAVVAAGAAVARTPLPTWPDGLGNAFHVRFDVAAPVVWHLEQLRSGITALEPAWGALRLASLASCAALWAVASVVLREASEPGTMRRSGASSTRRRLLPEAYPSD